MSRFERSNIKAMRGYSWGEQPDDDRTIKLNTNENPFPPSPRVQEALSALDVGALRTYPQPTADPLRDALADLHGVERNNIVVTNGGDEALRLAFTTFAAPGDIFGMVEPSYSLYPVLANIADLQIVAAPLTGDWRLPQGSAETLHDASLTCLVNPHAPSGHLLALGEVRDLAQALPGILLVDEAYADFVDPALDYRSVDLLECDNVLILRSFSKGYSLAGLRLGYLLGCESLITPIIEKTRDSYNIDHISQQIGLAAIGDQAYARQTWNEVRSMREQLRDDLRKLGLTSPPTQTNFILASVPQGSGPTAAELYAELKRRGILVRYFATDLLADKLRISVGTAEQNAVLLGALGELCKSAEDR